MLTMTAGLLATLDFRVHGAEHRPRAASSIVGDLLRLLADLPQDQAGVRINGVVGLYPYLATDGAIGSVATSLIGTVSRPVRAILFDKTSDMNWSLAWHQDRTICVRQRIDVAGFGPWTMKAGMQHVAPPFGILARMVTLRVHLDDVPASNAPLLVAPGSHRMGRVAVGEIEDAVGRCGTSACLAQTGDIWAYSTPIIHASDTATAPARRRVLQVDYSADELPGGLEWLGV